MFKKIQLFCAGFFILGFIVGSCYSTWDSNEYGDLDVDIMRNKISILECDKRSNELKDMQRRLDDLMTNREEE